MKSKKLIKEYLTLFDINNLERISYRQDINGLRAVSVLGVVFYHADVFYLKGGWLGVDMFFLISGYLISNIIISEMNQGVFTFKNFYIRRIKRILPALFSTLFFSSFFAYWILSPEAIVQYAKSQIASIFFAANFYFQNLDFYNLAPTKFMPLIHTWSLAIEEQFYLIFPVVIFAIYKFLNKHLVTLLIIFTFFSIYLNAFVQENIKFYQLQFRIWEFLFGAILMILNRKISFRSSEKIGFPLVIFSFYFFGDDLINNIEPKLLSLLGISLIIISNNKKSYIFKLLSSKYISLIGLSSFSIYLFHQPIFAFYRIYINGRFRKESFIELFFLIFLLLFISYFSYIYIEVKLTKSKLIYYILIFTFLIILLFSIFIIFSDGLDFRFEKTYSSLEKYFLEEQRGGVDVSDCSFNLISNFTHFCNTGFDKGKENIVIMGDSHLRTTSKYLNNTLKDNFNIFIAIKDGCPFLLPLNNESKAGCSDERKLEEFNLIRSQAKTTVIFGGRFPWYYNGDSFESNLGTTNDDMVAGGKSLLEGLEQNIDYMLKNSDKLIVIKPIPELGVFPLEAYLYGFYELNEAIMFNYEQWNNYSNDINKVIENSNASIVSPDEILCNSFQKNKCVASDKGIMFYYDDDHLTLDGASLIGVEVISRIKNS